MTSGKPEIKPKFLYLNQALILCIALLAVYALHKSQGYPWSEIFSARDFWSALAYGTGLAVLLIILQIIITYLPEHLWEDDGTNLIFYRLPYYHLLPIMALGALAEEMLFRLAIQTGLFIITDYWLMAIVVSSLIFSVAHVRYLKKPLLFFIVWSMGIGLGWLYWWTDNIWSAVWCHFMINMVMVYFAKQGKFIPKNQQNEILNRQ